MPKIEWNIKGQASVWRASLRLEAAVVNSVKGAARPAKAPGKERKRTLGKPSAAGPGRKRAANRKGGVGQGKVPLGNYPRQISPDLHRMDIFRSLLASLKPGRLLDLGCGVGNFSRMAREMGWEITAVDARVERFPSEATPGIEWVESDARDFRFGPNDYDCVCVLGLLYHLELPAQLDLLRRCASTFTLLDTHTALKTQVTEQGYEGRYFEEVPGAKTDQERRAALGSSWGNELSFWPTERSLMKMLEEVGFSLVAPVQPAYLPDRTFYLCYP